MTLEFPALGTPAIDIDAYIFFPFFFEPNVRWLFLVFLLWSCLEDNCGHHFCGGCMERWMDNAPQGECPVCRTPVDKLVPVRKMDEVLLFTSVMFAYHSWGVRAGCAWRGALAGCACFSAEGGRRCFALITPRPYLPGFRQPLVDLRLHGEQGVHTSTPFTVFTR